MCYVLYYSACERDCSQYNIPYRYITQYRVSKFNKIPNKGSLSSTYNFQKN